MAISPTEFGGASSRLEVQPGWVGRRKPSVACLSLGWGNKAALNANVSITSTNRRAPKNSVSTVVAKDDGLDPDSLASDGIYSALLDTRELGEYDVEAWATASLPDDRVLNRRARGELIVALQTDVAVFDQDIKLTPVSGANVLDVSVLIHNLGDDAADSVLVEFAGDHGVRFETVTIYGLAPGEARPVSVRWVRNRLLKRLALRVYANRSSAGTDISLANNRASVTFDDWPPGRTLVP